MNVETLIREINPTPRSGLRGPDSFEAATIFERSMIASAARGRRPVKVGGIALVGLGSVAGVALLISSILPGSPTRPTNAAAATLVHLAAVAAAQPATIPPGPGQFLYTESEELSQSCVENQPPFCYSRTYHRQIWIGGEQSGRIMETGGPPSFVTATDRSAWLRNRNLSIPSAVKDDTSFGPGTLTLELDSPVVAKVLSTDPAILGDMLSSGKFGPPGPTEAFVLIGDFLRETDASPALRAALYKVAATLPGVKALGPVRDHSGRLGVGIARTNRGAEQQYVFDPTTSALLGEQTVVVDPKGGFDTKGLKPGDVVAWRVNLSAGIVDSLSETPIGRVAPAPPVSVVAVPGHPGESRRIIPN